MLAVPFEIKPVRSRSFIRREASQEAIYLRRCLIQEGLPDMHLVIPQNWRVRRNGAYGD
jgi:hypothetical protein